jgi:hypothetical protein
MTKKLFAALVAAALVAACTDSLTEPQPQDTPSSVQPRFDDEAPPPDTTCKNGMLGSGTRC